MGQREAWSSVPEACLCHVRQHLKKRNRRLGQRGKLGQTDEASGAQPTEDDLLAIPLVHSSTLAPGQPVMRGFSLNIDQ